MCFYVPMFLCGEFSLFDKDIEYPDSHRNATQQTMACNETKSHLHTKVVSTVKNYYY